MALQATFTANFDNFNRALADAQQALTRDFELPVRNLQNSLTNLAKGFSGADIIAQAEKMAVAVASVGGAAALTDREQAKVNATVSEAIQKYERLGKEVPADLQRLADETRRVEDQTSKWSIAAGAVASTLGNLAARAIEAIGTMAWDTVKAGVIDFNATLETSQLQFETLTGSADRADEIVRGLFEFAKTTPFETNEVIEAARKLEVFGGAALNTQDNLRLVGDAAAATGAPIQEVSFWVGRMYAAMAANKPIGESIQNLMQLGVVGPEAASALTSVAASSVSTSEKFAVMQENLSRFSGAMEKQAGTWTGIMSTFSDVVTMAIGTMGKPIFDALKDITSAFNDFAGSDGVTAFIDAIGKDVGAGIKLGVDAIRSLVDILKTGMDPSLRAVSTVIDTFQGAFDAVTRTFASWQPHLQSMTASLQAFGRTVLDSLPSLGDSAWTAFSSVLRMIGEVLGFVYDLAVPLIATLYQLLEPIASSVWTAFVAVLSAVFDGISVVANVITVLFGALRDLNERWGIWNGLVAVAEAILMPVVSGITALVDVVTAVYRRFSEAADGVREFLGLIGVLAPKLPEVGRSASEMWDTQSRAFNNSVTAAGAAAAAIGKVDASLGMVAGISLSGTTGEVTKVGAASGDAEKAAKKHAEEIAKLAGSDVLAGARTMADAIKESGLSAVTAAQGVDKVHEAMRKAIDVALAQGKTVPQAWLDTYMATLDAEKGLNAYVTGVPKIGQAMKAVDPGLFFKELAAAANKELPKVIDGIPAFLTEIGTKFDEGARNLGPTFGNALQAGFGGSAKVFGQNLSTTIVDAVKGGGDVGGAIGSFVGQGIGNSLNTWAQGALANVSGAMGGLLSGAANAVLPGVGALLGQGMSAIMDKIFKKEEQKVNDMRDKFIESAGGLHELNVKATEAGLSLDRLLDAKKTKDFDAAVKEIEAALAKFQERVADLGTDLESTLSTGTLLTKNLAAEMVALSKNDQAQQSIFQFLTGSIQQVTEGFNQSVGAWTANLSTVAAEVGKNADGLTQLKQLAFDNADEFERFGTIAVSAFEAARASGMSVPAALAAIKPGLDQLREAAASVGLSSEGAFGNMLRFAELSDQFKPMLDSVTGLDKVMTGLANTGLMTQETFDAITTSVTDVFNGMVAGGATAEEAMRLLQPQLQRIWEIENDMKFSTDGVNQELQEQAFNAGVVGNEFRSSGDKMTAAINNLVLRLTDLTDVMMGKLPQSAQQGAAGATAALKGIDSTGVANKVWSDMGWAFDTVGGNAKAGAEKATAALKGIESNQVANKVWSEMGWAFGTLGGNAQSGVNEINRAFNTIDPGVIQEKVHDMEWEFRQGIPRAATDGTYEVGREMVKAAGFVGDVNEEAADVVDTVGYELPGSSRTAAGAISDLRRSGVTDLNAIEAAIRAILFGRSPGGFKDFLPMTRQASQAIAELRRSSVPQLRELESLVTGISTQRLVSLPAGGSTLVGASAAAGAGASGARDVRLVLTDERARVLAEVVAEQLPYLA